MDRLIETTIHVGLSAPVKILHITDIHLVEFNSEDSDELHRFVYRRKVFYDEATEIEGHTPSKTQNEFFAEAIQTAEENGYLLVNTGDVYDINTAGNRAEFHRIADGHDMLYTPGGHEFQRRTYRTIQEPYPYPETIQDKVASYFPEFDFTMENRIVNGLNVVTIDNSLEYFNRKANERLKAEIAKGYPILLFMHVPLDNRYINRTTPVPEMVRLTEEDWRINDETVDLICENPLIVATVAGHSHEESIREFRGKPLYVTPGLYAGVARLITVD